ncbi:MAG TPA: aminotransferase class I/II-fold pyridoxal phosphate-dependent enzyme [Candidatus Hydrothermia bacterium]|nr:aminotransferase class I/II-fold pyridoxal phosphate-dependent enzyme [Candidatus Hydrothermae bacterium]MDD3648694.1 aminotransferase class I/II-fold pyridoxal phosphate-dependent enzyme [Candidatus Hydrothermia bacterium]MDD5572788.1 aminotransferase class I/II-fold pyridoxal phosphate-dependent enzyme [Candidatus Hydrothermia bacterium]HOK22446.1 aminotransferase class I/II-fold pyridoxal phosphate-dependent enzyme [Candidatus Hydrothermia bacterium]HOL23153.1 aminotransferase class I/II-
MALDRVSKVLEKELKQLVAEGRAKGKEFIVVGVRKAQNGKGPRFFLKGFGDREFIRMNSNSYLGMQFNEEVIKVEEETAKKYGVGPGAVRFISGTYEPHRSLEKKLAKFHEREDAMIYSAAYVTVIGVISSLVTSDTVVISDELNHNCIINAIRLSRPMDKSIYKHLDMKELEARIKEVAGKAKRVVVVTDGVFSMRGDYANLKDIEAIANKYDGQFEEGIITIVDDSHGVGAFGKTGRGTEEVTGGKADLLIGTMGKAFGVNGGYVVSSEIVTTYLREKAITYIYSNPITTAEAACVLKVVEMLDSPEGRERLTYLRELTLRFREGIAKLGYETIASEHPIVPLIVRDTRRTSDIVNYLVENGVLATGLNYPVVPKGDETIRFQINADHTPQDIDYVLGVLEKYKKERWH